MKIESVTIRHILDDSPDLSYLGEYTDDLTDGVIVCQERAYYESLPDDYTLPARGREFRGFRPVAGGEKIGTPEYYKYGLQDYARMEAYNRGDFVVLGVRAEAEIVVKDVIQTITSGGLWGLESDDKAELEAEGKNQLNELSVILSEIGFAKEDIDRAFLNVQENEG